MAASVTLHPRPGSARELEDYVAALFLGAHDIVMTLFRRGEQERICGYSTP